jgi:FAD-dependent urate hydroxylase
MAPLSAAVIGAGPYGLSVAAHLNAAGFDVAVFGEPMSFWESHMPKGMLLRSPRMASQLSSPTGTLTLDDFQRSIGATIGSRVPLDRFVAYGRWFQAKAVPNLDTRKVESVRVENGKFSLELCDGEQISAERVIVAAGIAPFRFRPPEYSSLPTALASHSSDHTDLSRFSDQRVAVVGAGQSALESAALLQEAGADVELLTRHPIRWSWAHPWMHTRTPIAKILYAWPDVGPAIISHFVARPNLFRSLPLNVQELWRRKSLTPNGTRWLEPRLRNVRATCLQVSKIHIRGKTVTLQLSDGSFREVDHILLATGYRVDITKYKFLVPDVIAKLATIEPGIPNLGPAFESSIKGLHFLGAPAVQSYGPLMRFIAGADFAARSVASAFEKQLTATRVCRSEASFAVEKG